MEVLKGSRQRTLLSLLEVVHLEDFPHVVQVVLSQLIRLQGRLPGAYQVTLCLALSPTFSGADDIVSAAQAVLAEKSILRLASLPPVAQVLQQRLWCATAGVL